MPADIGFSSIDSNTDFYVFNVTLFISIIISSSIAVIVICVISLN